MDINKGTVETYHSIHIHYIRLVIKQGFAI